MSGVTHTQTSNSNNLCNETLVDAETCDNAFVMFSRRMTNVQKSQHYKLGQREYGMRFSTVGHSFFRSFPHLSSRLQLYCAQLWDVDRGVHLRLATQHI